MYLVIWRYRVETFNRKPFETAYGSDGEWTALFSKFDGYIRTELLQDIATGEYMTIDYWRDVDYYARFHKTNHRMYRELDKRCDEFTNEETFVGAFVIEQEDANW